MTIHSLTAGADATQAQVGGKGFNLIAMLEAGLRVPPGFVLAVDFFDPWLEELRGHDSWTRFVEATPAGLGAACAGLLADARGLEWTERQRTQLADALAPYAEDVFFAVRSSSPEEDLEGSSFAGGYETMLGIARPDLEAAIRQVFASCLDERIAIYKRAHGFDVTDPKIAIVIQRQILSEIAGVGFSVNPLNNDHDEAVINANWGLGETVVSGTASPDFFVVRKHDDEIVARTVGGKETSLWMLPDGGTQERVDPRRDELCLTDAQILELVEQIRRVEDLYGKPMDIEWAIAENAVYLVQARPITTHFPLPAEMVTKPGERKRLYLDLTITVQGIFESLSVTGGSVFEVLISGMLTEIFGRDPTGDVEQTLPFVRDGRLFLNLSNALVMAGAEKVVGAFGHVDPLTGQALAALDLEAYKATSFKRFGLMFGAAIRMWPRFRQFRRGLSEPAETRRSNDAAIEALRQCIRDADQRCAGLGEFHRAVVPQLAKTIYNRILPSMISAKQAMAKIREQFPDPELADHLENLDKSVPSNITVQMGLELFELVQHLTAAQAPDVETLADNLARGRLDEAFSSRWQSFLAAYGHRGAKEIDIMSPRYREDPRMLLQQLVQFVNADQDGGSPLALYESSLQRRKASGAFLAERLQGRQRARLEQRCEVISELAGFREGMKFCLVLVIDALRQRVLIRGQEWSAAQRLDEASDVFFLTLNQISEAETSRELDLRSWVEIQRRYQGMINQCKSRCPVFDSRGRFHRAPPAPARPGEISGQAVSSGVAVGRVKVLHAPDEKPLLPGEILVARATDPGWTPLFVNAGAIVLEIGGPLQHGALVAREYGKPCVSGIRDATQVLRDGELIEVDGNAGVLRLLDDGETGSTESGTQQSDLAEAANA